MDQSAGIIGKYPPVVGGLIAGLGVGVLFAGMRVLGGSQDHVLSASLFIAVMSVIVGVLTYRKLAFRREGIAAPPHLIRSLPVATALSAIAFAIYGWGISVFFLEGPPEGESPIVRRNMTVLFFLMGAFLTYQRRRWPKASVWYQAAAALGIVLASFLIGGLIGLMTA
jgi:hypothetical protein